MSYIDNILHGGQHNPAIIDFLKREGFEKGIGPLGTKGMVCAVSNHFTVWLTVTSNVIEVYAEYNCGGKIARADFHFKQDDMDSFIEAYIDSVNWANEMMN